MYHTYGSVIYISMSSDVICRHGNGGGGGGGGGDRLMTLELTEGQSVILL